MPFLGPERRIGSVAEHVASSSDDLGNFLKTKLVSSTQGCRLLIACMTQIIVFVLNYKYSSMLSITAVQ